MAAVDHRKMLTLLSAFFFVAGATVAVAATPAPVSTSMIEPLQRLVVAVDRIDAGPLRAEELSLQLLVGASGADPMSLSLDVSKLALPAAAMSLGRLEWDCEHLRTLEPLVCEGSLRVAGRPVGRFAVDLSTTRTGLRWSQGQRSLAVEKTPDLPWRIAAQRIPIVWFQDFLRQLWPTGRIGEGRVSGALSIQTPDNALRIDAEFRLDDLGFDTPDGALAGASLELPLRLRYETDTAGTRIALAGRLKAGELLVSPIYLAVPEAGVAFAVEAVSQPEGRWQLPRWSWTDTGALVAEGEAEVDADGHVLALVARLQSADLATLRARYLDGVLAPAGFADLQLSGRGKGLFAFDADGVSALEIDVQEALAVDPGGRFALIGVNGDLRWSRDAMAADSRLGWQAAALYGIDIEAGALAFRNLDGQLALIEPLRAGVLGGYLRLDRLLWRPQRTDSPLRMEMGFALEALDLGSLSRRLGWPAFEGRLGGTLPNALYENNRVSFDGGLAMQLFGGEVRIDDLVLERPFGVAPSLAADLRFQDIDLAPLTGAFGFGKISGRLDGRIRDLRLVDWTPVAFDARLLTDRNWKGARRISQRAVQNISDLGGSGLIAGLQARLLRTFDHFGYERIGIGCVLKDNRCAMSGLRKRGDGYLIVEGRGLPRIEVVGFRRDVDWPTLVARLREATESGVRID